MKILLLYATNSGGTFLAGRTIKEVLAKDHIVEMKKADEVKPAELARYDMVIMGSPSWNFGEKQGQPHESFLQFTAKAGGITLPEKKFAVYGCGDSTYTYFCGAVDYLEDFVKKIKGRLAVEPLKIDGYFFDLTKNTRLVKSWAQKLSNAV